MFFLLVAFEPSNKILTSKTFIPWSAERPLQWSDFKGKPDNNTAEAALTASSIEFNYETNGTNLLRWTVNCKFFPDLSWSKKDNQSVSILKHEQLHFDITELYARLMRKRLMSEIKSIKDIPKFKSITSGVMFEWNEQENSYDTETQHSMNTARQQEWNQSVAEGLESLKDYTATTFTVQK